MAALRTSLAPKSLTSLSRSMTIQRPPPSSACTHPITSAAPRRRVLQHGHSRRALHSSAMRKQAETTSTPATPTPAPPRKKPVGAFRGGLMGFFLGTTLASATLFYYILDDYKLSNQLLNEDILALQASVERIAAYTQDLESQVQAANRKIAKSQYSGAGGINTPASSSSSSSSSSRSGSASGSSVPLASTASEGKGPGPLELPGAVGEGQGTGVKETA